MCGIGDGGGGGQFITYAANYIEIGLGCVSEAPTGFRTFYCNYFVVILSVIVV